MRGLNVSRRRRTPYADLTLGPSTSRVVWILSAPLLTYIPMRGPMKMSLNAQETVETPSPLGTGTDGRV